VCFDRIEPAYERYAQRRTDSTIEVWTLAHQLQRISQGARFRIVTERAATIRWSADEWATESNLDACDAGFGCWFADLASERLEAGARIAFTLRWQETLEQKDFQVDVDAPRPGK
jgi:glucoamylase